MVFSGIYPFSFVLCTNSPILNFNQLYFAFKIWSGVVKKKRCNLDVKLPHQIVCSKGNPPTAEALVGLRVEINSEMLQRYKSVNKYQ